MGHYWSEMRADDPPRNPTALESMGFDSPYSSAFDYGSNGLYVHRPCRQVFYIGHNKDRLPEAIWKHGNECV